MLLNVVWQDRKSSRVLNKLVDKLTAGIAKQHTERASHPHVLMAAAHSTKYSVELQTLECTFDCMSSMNEAWQPYLGSGDLSRKLLTIFSIPYGCLAASVADRPSS